MTVIYLSLNILLVVEVSKHADPSRHVIPTVPQILSFLLIPANFKLEIKTVALRIVELLIPRNFSFVAESFAKNQFCRWECHRFPPLDIQIASVIDSPSN